MHHGHRHHGHRRGMRFGRFNREQLSSRLEEYQRDLEQELSDVTDLLRRLRETEPEQPATA
ncbi:MAG: hypothetical protein QOE36_2572 [Gaiellaceae bacterium]|nr:hypothetical protein [Gaiellaceae bacterium]